MLIANNQIDAILINQISNEDAAMVELTHDTIRFYAVSMYLDIEKDINENGQYTVIHERRRTSNCYGSTMWHDTVTNARGRLMEEFISSKNIYIINEESQITTFENRIGKSNIDLTITNGSLIHRLNEWDCSGEESCSDHRFLTFNIAKEYRITELKFENTKYIIREEEIEEFNRVLIDEFSKILHNETSTNDAEELDQKLSSLVNTGTDPQKIIREYEDTITTACRKCFRTSKMTKNLFKTKSVPWWTQELTILRNKTKALRRRYQRTNNNEALREEQKTKYLEGKRKYQNTIRKEKTDSWKKYCNLTPSNNPWNAVYRLATGKIRKNTQLTTLKKPDGSFTQNLTESMNYMLENFAPDDKEEEDSEHHKSVRKRNREPLETQEDKAFTKNEISDILGKMDPGKSPGEDGLTSRILFQVHRNFPKYMTAIYNCCLTRGHFPNQWKRAKMIPIVKPGKQERTKVTKYCPISLLNIGGKVLEKLLINRIMHHFHTRNLLNDNQFGFTPQKSTTDAVMALEQYVYEGFKEGKFIVLVDLDVQGTFDAAW